MSRVLTLFLLLASPALAQVSATLSGPVTDQSGGLVPAAVVTVTNVDTGASRSTVSDAAGPYEFSSLPVGHYEVRGAKPGFTEEVHPGVQLAVGQSATVSDAAIASATTSPASNLEGERQIRDLPLNGRSYDELLTFGSERECVGTLDSRGFPASGRRAQSRALRARAQGPGFARPSASPRPLLSFGNDSISTQSLKKRTSSHDLSQATLGPMHQPRGDGFSGKAIHRETL